MQFASAHSKYQLTYLFACCLFTEKQVNSLAQKYTDNPQAWGLPLYLLVFLTEFYICMSTYLNNKTSDK